MIHFFSFIAHTKGAKIVLLGEPDHFSPLVFTEGLVCLINYFIEKEGFLKYYVVVNK